MNSSFRLNTHFNGYIQPAFSASNTSSEALSKKIQEIVSGFAPEEIEQIRQSLIHYGEHCGMPAGNPLPKKCSQGFGLYVLHAFQRLGEPVYFPPNGNASDKSFIELRDFCNELYRAGYLTKRHGNYVLSVFGKQTLTQLKEFLINNKWQ